MKYIMYALTMMIFTSCATRYLTDSENISEHEKIEKIAVFSNTPDKLIQKRFEESVVQNLISKGKNAESVMAMNIQTKDASEVLMIFRKANVDAVLITQLLDSQEYQKVIPGNIQTYYYPTYFGRYWGYYPATYWGPDQIVSGKVYYAQTALYDLRKENDNLIWVGRFEIYDPTNLQKVVKKYATELTEELTLNVF